MSLNIERGHVTIVYNGDHNAWMLPGSYGKHIVKTASKERAEEIAKEFRDRSAGPSKYQDAQ